MKTKKIFGAIVAIAMMLVGSLPTFAHDFEVDGIYYNITSSTDLTVAVTYQGDSYSSYSNEYSGDVVIPESVTYDNTTYTVTSIGGSAFSRCSGLTSVTIPNSVTSIGGSAFSRCSGLTGELVIPNSVTSIGGSAFYGCSGLTGELVIPNSVTSIGDYAFNSCSGFTGELVIPNSVASIGNSAFQDCSGLTSVTIGNSVTSIEKSAFYGCSRFTGELVIPNSVTSIGGSAFRSCSGLTSVTIPNSVTSIGDKAFEYCSGLTGELVIPNSVTSIGDKAFEYCSGLTGELVIPNSVTSIGDQAFFDCSGLTGELVIPESVTSIGGAAFHSCSRLTSLIIGNSVTSIGESAFSSCSRLTGVLTLPASLKTIGSKAFYDTNYKVFNVLMEEPASLQTDALPSTLETLIVPLGTKEAYEDAAYWQDVELIIEDGSCEIEVSNETAGGLMEAIVIEVRETPAYVTGMKVTGTLNDTDIAAIKSNMTSLLRLDISETDYTALPDKAFKDKMTLFDIKLPAGLTTIGAEAFSNCVALAETIVIPSTVTSIGDNAFYNCKYIPAITLSSGLKSIGSSAFSGCGSITSIEIPNTVTSIGSSAFSGCHRLTTATLPMTLTTLPSSVFSGCSSLSDITFPTSLTSIGASAFTGCSSLAIIDLAECEGLTTIGASAFADCKNVGTINFPASLESIGAEAFSYCTSLQEMSVPTTTPPALADDSKPFAHVDNLTCVLSVPKESWVTYLNTPYWGAFVSVEAKEEIDVEVGTESEIEDGTQDGSGSGNDGGGKCKHHKGCKVHFHKGGHKGNSPHHMPGMRREVAEETYTADAVTYSGSSVFVEGEECVTFVFTVQEGYEIAQVLYGGEDVTSQLVGNTFTTPVAEAGGQKSLQVILSGGPQYELGDVNADEKVNITDAVSLINYILGSSSTGFVADVADLNGDEKVNITDVVALINKILGTSTVSEAPSETVGTTTSELTLSGNGFDETGVQTIEVGLTNDREFTAFQADLQLPEGIELQGAMLSERAGNSHALNFAELGDNTYRLMSYSLMNESYSGTSGNLFTLILKASEEIEKGVLTMSEIIFSTPQAEGCVLDDVVVEIGGTTSVSTLPTATIIYVQGGNIIIESPKDCESMISGVDGTTQVVETKAGRNVYPVCGNGLYIVRSGEKVTKLMVK